MRSNQNKIIYGLVIVLLFGAMFPYGDWLTDVKKSATTWARPRSARSIPAAS